MSFERAQAVADAVLLEGYVLYPYRRSSAKNRFRWAFGVLAPRAWSEAGGCEPWWLQTQVLLEPAALPHLAGRARFLQLQRRTVEEAAREQGEFRAVESLEVNGERHFAWDEGAVRELDFRLALSEAAAGETVRVDVPFAVPAGTDLEPIGVRDGGCAGRVVRTRWSAQGLVRVTAEPVAAERPLVRITARLENLTPWDALDAPRDEALRAAFIATHLLLEVKDGAFLSLLDPPEWAVRETARLENVRTYPTLAGAPGSTDLVLSAPFILYDHAQVAPESAGDMYDATEIDEILTLRTLTLTDEEKREARATDARAAAVVERAEGMVAERLGRLHGALRDLRRGEMVPRARGVPASPPGAVPPEADGSTFPIGTRVRLRPGKRRTDAQDLLYAGRLATVQGTKDDVDGRRYVAVTLDDDPAAELNRWYGRFHYYELDEVERLSSSESEEVEP